MKASSAAHLFNHQALKLAVVEATAGPTDLRSIPLQAGYVAPCSATPDSDASFPGKKPIVDACA